MKEQRQIREYKTSDKEAVLNLLRLNTPKYFSPEEEAGFVYYLDHEIESYFVVEMKGLVVGCGGINFAENKKTGVISWDIFHPDFQGQSLGSRLLKYRIEKLKGSGNVQRIIVRTSQLAYKFYEKSGFKLTEITEDYWAKGFHLYCMEYADF
jgi:[ribosomal protein S18]-alanine N-acetyltransferase